MIRLLSFLFVMVTCSGSKEDHQNTAFEYAALLHDDFPLQMMAIYSAYCGQYCTEKDNSLPTTAYNSFCHRCYCDSTCSVVHDCCPDSKRQEIGTSSPWECKPSDVYPKSKSEYQMITSCRQNYDIDNTVAQMCHNTTTMSHRQPITDPVSNFTYRNKYCAACHNVNDGLPWSLDIICDGQVPDRIGNTPEDAYKSFKTTKNCYTQFNDVTGTAHSCQRITEPIISTCNQTGLWPMFDANIKKGCETFGNNVVKTYLNVFCYFCNTDLDWENLKKDRPEEVSDRTEFITGTIDYSLGYSNFNMTDARTNDEFCPLHQMWDPYKCLCRNLSCADGRMLVNRTCREILPVYDGYMYVVCVQLEVNTTDEPKSRSYQMDYLQLTGDELKAIPRIKMAFSKVIVAYISPCQDILTLKVLVEHHFMAHPPASSDAIMRSALRTIHDLPLKRSTQSANISLIYVKECDKPDFSEQGDEEFCRDVNTMRFERRWRRLNGRNMMLISEYNLCVSIHINVSEASLSDDLKSLTILTTNTVLSAEKFQIANHGYLVCDYDYIPSSLRNSQIYCNVVEPISLSYIARPKFILIGISILTIKLRLILL